MLSIGKLGPGTELYYERNIVRGVDDYYSGRGESPGRWLGRGAAALGLEGLVQDGALTALTNGQHRDSGEVLRTHPVKAVAMLDLTFSAPSFELAWEPIPPVPRGRPLPRCGPN